MKQMMNITTMQFELERYESREDLRACLGQLGLDGLELLAVGEDTGNIIMADEVIGVHLRNVPCWYCVWSGDTGTALEEFGSRAEIRRQLGGTDREAILRLYRDSLEEARRYHPRYVVFHVSDVLCAEAVTRRFRYSDEEIVDAAAEILNEILPEDEGFELLLENLWWPGLTLTRPQVTYRLLEKVRYPRTGLMLDTGHLMHTNTALRTTKEAADYVCSVLETYPDRHMFRGVHLHQTLSGAYVEEQRRKGLSVAGESYLEKMERMTDYAWRVDSHQPFPAGEAGAILELLQPEYLVYELITQGREEYRRALEISRLNH